MRQGAAVLTRALPELCSHAGGIHTAFVPLVEPGEFLLFLRLGPLMFERGPRLAEVPRSGRDVLRDVRVDVLALLVDGGWHCTQLWMGENRSEMVGAAAVRSV